MSFPRARDNSHHRHIRRGDLDGDIKNNYGPADLVQFADSEPRWGWGGNSVRFNYNISWKGHLAKSTHEGKPNITFMDGHVARIDRDKLDNDRIRFRD